MRDGSPIGTTFLATAVLDEQGRSLIIGTLHPNDEKTLAALQEQNRVSKIRPIHVVEVKVVGRILQIEGDHYYNDSYYQTVVND